MKHLGLAYTLPFFLLGALLGFTAALLTLPLKMFWGGFVGVYKEVLK